MNIEEENNDNYKNIEPSVIGINYDGKVKREVVIKNKEQSGHQIATRVIAEYFGVHIDENKDFLDVPLAASNEGILIMQFIPNPCMIFFPEEMTDEHLEGLGKSLNENSNLNYIYTINNEMHDEIFCTSNEIYDIASSIVESRKVK